MDELLQDMQKKNLAQIYKPINFSEFLRIMDESDEPYKFIFGKEVKIWLFDTIPDNSYPKISERLN